ncbi:MAG: hypothetical protein AAGJ83_14700, partial [Planctomycetota bacterium]
MQTSPSPDERSGNSDGERAFEWIRPERFTNWPQSKSHLHSIWNCGAPEELLRLLGQRLAEQLDDLIDLDALVMNLDRFITASRSPTSLLSLFERDETALSALLRVFMTSQTLANRLIADPESFDLMRASDGQGTERKFLVDEMVAELQPLDSPNRAAIAIRKFVSRETVRIAYGEFIRQLNADVVGKQLTYVADAVLEASLVFVLRRLAKRDRIPVRIDGHQV